MSAATPQEQILGIVNNHWQSCCVGAAAQLELADLLADGPLNVDILAREGRTMVPPMEQLAEALRNRGYDGLTVDAVVFEDETHTSVVPRDDVTDAPRALPASGVTPGTPADWLGTEPESPAKPETNAVLTLITANHALS